MPICPRLPWKFVPEQETVRIHPGARTTIYYDATNYTARSTTGQAIFNVTPESAGKYFSKIECFCFTEQTLKPGESVRMPVVFFVDPKLRQDPTPRTSTRSPCATHFIRWKIRKRPARARRQSQGICTSWHRPRITIITFFRRTSGR